MSEKMLSCPFCGKEAKSDVELMGKSWDLWECSDDDCPNRGCYTKEEWNRRFICPDSNGKPVSAGDKVICSIGDRVYPVHDTVIISEHTPYLRTRAVTLYDWWLKTGGEITLIEAKGE